MSSTTKQEESQHAMEGLLAEHVLSFPKIGDMVEGEVISVGRNEVLLDIDGVSTGVIRGRELYDESGEFSNLNVGEQAQAMVVDLENERGLLELSFRIAGHQKAWQHLEDLKKDGTVISVQAVDTNKGGLIVQLGQIYGFLPVSQLAPEHYPRVEGGNKQKILEKLQSYIGNSFDVKVIDVDENEEKLIVSERATQDEQIAAKLAGKNVGDEIAGKVTSVVDFGIFVEIDEGLEGLVHISELSWQRVDHPRDIAKVGDEVNVKIIEISNGKISLSIKRLMPDPWQQIAKDLKVGSKITGKAVKLNPFGVFVEVQGGLQGLAHISELKSTQGSDGEMLEVGKEYEFKVIAFDPERHKLGLSRKGL